MTDLPNSGGGGTDFGCTRVMFKRKILIFLIINLSFHHDFFFGIRSAKLKKNKKIKNFIGRDVNNHIDLERAKKDY